MFFLYCVIFAYWNVCCLSYCKPELCLKCSFDIGVAVPHLKYWEVSVVLLNFLSISFFFVLIYCSFNLYGTKLNLVMHLTVCLFIYFFA
jgi:hypothetical protein